MKHALLVLLFLTGSRICLAQQDAQSGIHLFYQRSQGFDYGSGSTSFDLKNAHLNGGGFGFVYGITERFGLWQQVSFYSALQQGSVRLNLIDELQGLRLSSGAMGPLRLYAKGGMGFTRYLFDLPSFRTVQYGQAFNYGGGAEIRLRPGISLVLEATQVGRSLPNLTGVQNRDKWDSSLQVTTGLAIHF